jgi:hypothetical protein
MSAPDNSSHHIYLYGGIDPITNKAYDDVLILTLPSFTWTNVWPIGESPRWGHNCHVAGKRQMLTVGGNMTSGPRCDWQVKGVAVWDLSSLTWGSMFLSNLSEYTVPRKVLGLTGGTVNGNATIRDPALGWTDQGLKTVFETPRKAPAPSTNTTTSLSPSKSHTSTIAGGVVGGIACLALISLLAFFLFRRHRKKHAAHELHSTSSIPPHPESGSEKQRHELQAVNENSPAELWGLDSNEYESPRHAHEADSVGVTRRAELPGTNTAPGAVHGVPIIRTPGDELPERPKYVAGVRRMEEGREKELPELPREDGLGF